MYLSNGDIPIPKMLFGRNFMQYNNNFQILIGILIGFEDKFVSMGGIIVISQK